MDLLKTLELIDYGKLQVEYCDIRLERSSSTNIGFQQGDLTSCNTNPKLGAFIRVFHDGNWYYKSTTEVERLEHEAIALIEDAKKGLLDSVSRSTKPYNTESTKFYQQNYTENFTHIPLEEKIQLLKNLLPLFNKDEVRRFDIYYQDLYREKAFRSSTQISFYYDSNLGGVAIDYTVADGDAVFDDLEKISFDDFEDLKNIKQDIQNSLKKSCSFIYAKPITKGVYPTAMSEAVVGVFAHESFGHKSESDFMIGDERAKEAWKIGSKVGHECLSIVDHGANHRGSGYCPIDDEGYPTQKTYLIKNGILSGRLHNIETAGIFQEKPTGNARAMNFEFEPIVRMTDTYVEPEDKTFEELIKEVKEGLYVERFKSGSGMSTFTIVPIRSYMIRNGVIAEPVKASVISGDVFSTLNKIEGCSSDFEVIASVFGGCGKMEQFPLPVGFGGAKILVSELNVG